MKMRKNLYLGVIVLVGLSYIVYCIVSEEMQRQSLSKWNSTIVPNGFISSQAALKLPRSGNIFCFVMAAEKIFQTRVQAINATWLKRCDHGQIFTSKALADESIPFSTVFNGLSDAYDRVFFKSVTALYTIYTNISSDFDWYYKADDNTYVVVENLRRLLSRYDPSKPYLIGHYWSSHHGYHSVGAGYAISNAAMKLFVEKAFGNSDVCPFNVNENIGITECLRNIGISPTHSEEINQHFSPSKRGRQTRRNPLSLSSIHYQTPEDIYKLEEFYLEVKRIRLEKKKSE